MVALNDSVCKGAATHGCSLDSWQRINFPVFCAMFSFNTSGNCGNWAKGVWDNLIKSKHCIFFYSVLPPALNGMSQFIFINMSISSKVKEEHRAKTTNMKWHVCGCKSQEGGSGNTEKYLVGIWIYLMLQIWKKMLKRWEKDEILRAGKFIMSHFFHLLITASSFL